VSDRILVVHALFDVLGGGELFALRLTQALMEHGFNVDLLTATLVDQDKLREIFGDVKLPRIMVKRVKEAEYLSKLMPGRLVRLRRLVVYRKYLPIIEEAKREYDLVIDTQSNLPTPVDISYVHFPILLPTRRGGLYWTIYNQLVDLLAGDCKNPRSGRILANSTWTAHMVYRVYGIIPDILYPPVDVEYFSTVAGNTNREKLVITISRFTPEKKLDGILEVARELPDYTFIISGSTGPGSERIIEALKARKEQLGLTNIEFKPNMPRQELREQLGEAMFYLHPEFTEHFGIAVIEAMAAGVVPIVYRDGGAWHDVVSKVSVILGYQSISEVPKIVRRLGENKDLYSKLRERSIELSKDFNYENFKKNLLEKARYVLRVKKLR
jgi:Glycosyltransferase